MGVTKLYYFRQRFHDMKIYTYNKIISCLHRVLRFMQLLYEVQLNFITKFCFSFTCSLVAVFLCSQAYHNFWRLESLVFRERNRLLFVFQTRRKT